MIPRQKGARQALQGTNKSISKDKATLVTFFYSEEIPKNLFPADQAVNKERQVEMLPCLVRRIREVRTQ
jgi:hypothetical protein